EPTSSRRTCRSFTAWVGRAARASRCAAVSRRFPPRPKPPSSCWPTGRTSRHWPSIGSSTPGGRTAATSSPPAIEATAAILSCSPARPGGGCPTKGHARSSPGSSPATTSGRRGTSTTRTTSLRGCEGLKRSPQSRQLRLELDRHRLLAALADELPEAFLEAEALGAEPAAGEMALRLQPLLFGKLPVEVGLH